MYTKTLTIILSLALSACGAYPVMYGTMEKIDAIHIEPHRYISIQLPATEIIISAQDSFFAKNYPTTIYGNSPVACISNDPEDTNPSGVKSAAVQFDSREILDRISRYSDAGQPIIKSANLVLQPIGSKSFGGITVFAKLFQSSWDEELASLKCNEQQPDGTCRKHWDSHISHLFFRTGNPFDLSEVSTEVYNEARFDVLADIRRLIEGSLSGNSMNWMLRLGQKPKVHARCFSTKEAGENYAPRLEIEIQIPYQEKCDGVDNDLDGEIDEGFDLDGDGFFTCVKDSKDIDCDDSNPKVNPGMAEICDGIDNDCNGIADMDSNHEVDLDRDGVLSCLDCDDSNPYINPSLEENCDGIDNNCNGLIDEAINAYTHELRENVCAWECIPNKWWGPQPLRCCEGLDEFYSPGFGRLCDEDL